MEGGRFAYGASTSCVLHYDPLQRGVRILQMYIHNKFLQGKVRRLLVSYCSYCHDQPSSPAGILGPAVFQIDDGMTALAQGSGYVHDHAVHGMYLIEVQEAPAGSTQA
jgi:hypothetical protein